MQASPNSHRERSGFLADHHHHGVGLQAHPHSGAGATAKTSSDGAGGGQREVASCRPKSMGGDAVGGAGAEAIGAPPAGDVTAIELAEADVLEQLGEDPADDSIETKRVDESTD